MILVNNFGEPIAWRIFNADDFLFFVDAGSGSLADGGETSRSLSREFKIEIRRADGRRLDVPTIIYSPDATLRVKVDGHVERLAGISRWAILPPQGAKSRLRVLTYNLNESKQIDNIVEDIRRQRVDIALLNEAMFWRFGQDPTAYPGIRIANNVDYLRDKCELRYACYVEGNWLGLAGIRLTAILSRFPLGQMEEIDTWAGLRNIGYDTVRAPISVGGRTVHLYSLRWPHNDAALNLRCAVNAVASLQRIPPADGVIFGGDFNSPNEITAITMQIFTDSSGLRQITAIGAIDQIHIRGSWRVVDSGDLLGVSDHPLYYADLAEPFTATYGGLIKLAHDITGHRLHSHPPTYGHPGSSKLQQVTAFAGADMNDWWMIVGPFGTSLDFQRGQAVHNGDTVRLFHAVTGKLLHSHGNHRSPASGQQEVTGFLWPGNAESNWRVEIVGVDRGLVSWECTDLVRLIHTNTGAALHSHRGFSHPQWTQGQQEVTGFYGRDENDLWRLAESG